MFIVTQDRKAIVNTMNALYLEVIANEIRVICLEKRITVGAYNTEERTRQVLEYIASSIARNETIINLPEG